MALSEAQRVVFVWACYLKSYHFICCHLYTKGRILLEDEHSIDLWHLYMCGASVCEMRQQRLDIQILVGILSSPCVCSSNTMPSFKM